MDHDFLEVRSSTVRVNLKLVSVRMSVIGETICPEGYKALAVSRTTDP